MMYNIPNYQPGAGTPALSPTREAAARRVNAEYLRPDGEQVCQRRFGRWLVADWLDGEFGAWREIEEYPDGWLRL